jgi:HEAT repeat protein
LKRRFPLVALLIACFLPALALGADDWKKTFNEKFSSKNSWEKAAALKSLDPNNPDQLKMLLQLSETTKNPQEWYFRAAIADVLAGKLEAKAADELKKALKTGQGGIAEIVATAYGRAKDADKTDELIEALEKAKDWKVRRAAAIALGNIPSKKGVGALIKTLDAEAKNFMVQVHIIEALERATQEKANKTAQDWKGWWTGAESSWEPPKGDAKADASGEGDKKPGDELHTTVRGTDLDFRSRGKGRPLLVLPEYGFEKDYMETYLRNLEESNQILYLKLPAIADFKDPKLENAPNLPNPFYPIDRLVDALEAAREEFVKGGKIAEKSSLAIMGHGITCWVAIRYANKYPKSVSRLVLLSTYASDKAFERDRKAMEEYGKKTGDDELMHYAQSLLYDGNAKKHIYEPANEDDGKALRRKQFTTFFGDWHDIEIGRLLGPIVEKRTSETTASRDYNVYRDVGGCFIPQFDMAKESTISQPCLIVSGEQAFFGSPDDCNEIAKQCDKPRVEVIKGARMPMIEENAKFVSTMLKHLH